MDKVRIWLDKTGITNVAYLVGGIAAGFMGWTFVSGVCFGIFGYVNYNVISKLVKEKITPGD